jgi:hypothetical protein
MIKSKRMRRAGNVTRTGRRGKNVDYWLESHKERDHCPPRWIDNIEMDLGEIGWGDVDWISLIQDKDKLSALMNAVIILRVP